jgi:hypothetical protein
MQFIFAALAAAIWPVVFTWVLSAIAAAMIYADRGRRGGVGFLGGLVFGPIGVLLTLLTPIDRVGQERRLLTSGRYRSCPACAELARAAARICLSCRSELPEAAMVEPTAPLIRVHRADDGKGLAIELRRPTLARRGPPDE